MKMFGIMDILKEKVIRSYPAKAMRAMDLPANQLQFEMKPEFGDHYLNIDAYNWTGTQVLYDVNYVPPKNVPNFLTARQLRLVLLNDGVTATDVEAQLNLLPEPDRSAALIDWEYATEFDRGNPMIGQLGAALGYTTDQVDDLYVAGALL